GAVRVRAARRRRPGGRALPRSDRCVRPRDRAPRALDRGRALGRAARGARRFARGRRERLVLASRCRARLARKPLSVRAAVDARLPGVAEELPRPAAPRPQPRRVEREPRRVRRHSRHAPARVRAEAAADRGASRADRSRTDERAPRRARGGRCRHRAGAEFRRARQRRAAGTVARALGARARSRAPRQRPGRGAAARQAAFPQRPARMGARARLQVPALAAEDESAPARPVAEGSAGAPLSDPCGERGVAGAACGADGTNRGARAAHRRAAQRGARRARSTAAPRRGARGRGARDPARAARGLPRAGPLLARRALRPRVVAAGGARARRGGRQMSAGPVLAAAVLAALWPFGRNRGDEPVTIESLEQRVVEIDVGAPIPASEEKAIESYRRFLELAADDPLLRAEAMRRLADLEIETAEIAAEEDAFTRLDDSIALYRELLESHPGYAKRDLVLYQLARAYEAQGDVESALETLDLLVTAHPDTVHYDEANFRRGEALFSGGRYAEAEDAYRRVLERGPHTAFYGQALYKHGWSLFKQDRHRAALESFLGLLDTQLGADPGVDSAARFAAMGRAEQELVEDTLRVASIAFSYLDGPASIAEALERAGPRPYAYILYMNLGDLYVEQERWQDAAGAYSAFADREPWHEKAPLLQAEAIGAFERGGFADLVLDGKRGFVERYGPGSPYWTRHTFDEQP